MAKAPRLEVQKLGPIEEAAIDFGDLTVIVGPQATGKSILLQTLNLILDRPHVHHTFERHNVTFKKDDFDGFMGGYFGRGMAAIWQEGQSSITWNGKSEPLPDLSKKPRQRKKVDPAKGPPQQAFFIPAQRVVSLPGGVSQNFSNFKYGDPYVLRQFSDTVHDLLQNEFGSKGELFPQTGRLNKNLRDPIVRNIFGKAKLAIDTLEFTKTMLLKLPGHKVGLPYLAWSAGQREFTPLLLGLYWLCTAGKVPRRDEIRWVMIEEPEMGLHPDAISTLLLLVLELMRRDYKVILSTHSTVVVDLVWAMRQLQELGGCEADVRELFELKSNDQSKSLATTALTKDYCVYFFNRDGLAQNISDLDPGADSAAEAQWGGLTGFESRSNEVIAKAVNRAQAKRASRYRVADNDDPV